MILPFSAVVLAAGRSSRMGRDKALLADAKGQPLWQRQRDLLASAGVREIFLSARPEQAWAASVQGFAAVLPDKIANGGPLAGIVTAWEAAAHAHLVVLAIDLPRMEPRWIQLLLERSAPGIGVVGRNGNFFEPLAAVYPRELLPLAREALLRGDLSLQSLVARGYAERCLDLEEITAETAAYFENWNEPTR